MEDLTPMKIDFKATGNEPSWSLEIGFDHKMHFNSLNHPGEITTPVPEPDITQDAKVERYRAETANGELQVSIIADTCQDTMSGDKFPFTVQVAAKWRDDIDYTTFNGCGRFILDSRLHNIWVLTEMKGQQVTLDGFTNGLPTIELYPEEGKVVGHDGCNRLFGKIESQRGKIKFSPLGSTQMACPNMEGSYLFQKLISDQTLSYSVSSRQLILTVDDIIVMRLKHID